jgi:hypothetical protein
METYMAQLVKSQYGGMAVNVNTELDNMFTKM